MFRLSPLFAAAMVLTACGPQMVTSDVTRFHTLPPTASAEARTFTILPRPNQVGSLEFQQYAELIANRLTAQGYRPLPSESGTADVVVFLDFGVSTGPVEVRSSPVYGSVGLGYGFGRWPHRYGVGGSFPLYPFDGVVGYDTYSVTKYTRWVDIDMLKGPEFRAGHQVSVFEGRAVSEGAGKSLPAVMPYMVTALFDHFPGPSGQTVAVSVPVPEGGKTY